MGLWSKFIPCYQNAWGPLAFFRCIERGGTIDANRAQRKTREILRTRRYIVAVRFLRAQRYLGETGGRSHPQKG